LVYFPGRRIAEYDAEVHRWLKELETVLKDGLRDRLVGL
jgi:hypothetical protein